MRKKEVQRDHITVLKKAEVPKQKLNKYKEAFNKYDKDSSGNLSVNEIQKIAKDFGYPMTKEEVQEVFAEVGGDGNIDFDEFVMLMEEYIHSLGEDELLKAFKDYDKNNTGKMTVRDFKYIITNYGDDILNDREADDLFRDSGLRDKDYIQYEDFIKFWRSNMKN